MCSAAVLKTQGNGVVGRCAARDNGNRVTKKKSQLRNSEGHAAISERQHGTSSLTVKYSLHDLENTMVCRLGVD